MCLCACILFKSEFSKILFHCSSYSCWTRNFKIMFWSFQRSPPGLATTFLDIFDCRKMSYNVEKCQGMSRNVEEFGREMSKNVEECREMLWNVEKCRRNDIKTHVGNDIFLHTWMSINVEECRRMSKNVEKCRRMSKNWYQIPGLATTFFDILDCR